MNYTGSGGNDTMTGSSSSDTFYLKAGNDLAYGYGSSDTIAGQGGADELYGGDSADMLYGGGGNDTLLGESDADDVIGGNGNDVLEGGQGADGNSGGAGADRFFFHSASDANGDWIHDFHSWEGDKIDLHTVDANYTPWWNPFDWCPGIQAFDWMGDTGGATLGKGELGYVHSDGTTYVYGNTDGDSAAEFTIGLTGTLYLTRTDFLFSSEIGAGPGC
jgi:RTX calcium-binding nonapeptide repeat (4 copies)